MKVSRSTLSACALAVSGWFAVAPASADPIEVAPCGGCNFIDYGGPVLSAPKTVYLIYYGSGISANVSSSLPDFIGDLAGSDYLNLLTLYSPTGTQSAINPSVSYGGSYSDSAYLSGKTLTSQSSGTINNGDARVVDRAIGLNNLPNDPNGIYVLLTDVFVTNFGDGSYSGYHSVTPNGHVFAVIDFKSIQNDGLSPLDGATFVLSHELFEAITDPMFALANPGPLGPPVGWYGGQEIADACGGTSFALPGTSFQTQAVFVPTGGDNTSGYTGICASGVSLPASAVPGPIAGAGLPGLIFAGAGLLGWWRRKRKAAAIA